MYLGFPCTEHTLREGVTDMKRSKSHTSAKPHVPTFGRDALLGNAVLSVTGLGFLEQSSDLRY